MVRLNLPNRRGKQTHVFLTHNWSKDRRGRNNHDRVTRVNEALKRRGFITWFDSERMQGSLRKLMTEGIESTLVLIVFITKDYVDKVNGDDERDNCRYEFSFGVEQIGPQNMLACVMEPDMRIPRGWKVIHSS